MLRRQFHERYMFKLLNYDEGDTIAVGLERPKTTALFFDKLWIPSQFRHSREGHLLGYDKVPLKLCIVEEIEESIYRTDNYMLLFSNNKEADKNKKKDPNDLDIMSYISPNRPYLTVEEDVLGLEIGLHFLYSQNRNLGLKNVANSFKKKYGIEIVPIFVGRTAFEESISKHDEETLKLQIERYKHSCAINKFYSMDLFPVPNLKEYATQETCCGYQVIIENVPSIIEKKLSWEQVLEIRKDKTSIKKLRRLRNWVDADLTGKSREQISAIINQAIDDYKFAIKKHGVLTTAGSIATVLSYTATIASAIPDGFTDILSAGLVVTAGIITFTATQISNYFKERRAPIAFIYDIQSEKIVKHRQ